MTEQPLEYACPGASKALPTSRFRQHLHAVECRGDVAAGEERQPHKVHQARCVTTGHLCPGCATDWPHVRSRHRLLNPPPDEFHQHIAADSAKRIKDSLQAATARRRERDAARLQKDT